MRTTAVSGGGCCLLAWGDRGGCCQFKPTSEGRCSVWCNKCVGVGTALRPKNWPTRRVARAEKWQTSEDWRGRQRESRTGTESRPKETMMDLLGIVTGATYPMRGPATMAASSLLPHAAEARSWGLLPSALQCVRSGLGAWWSTETLDRPTSPAPQLPDLPAHDWAHATGRQNITNSDRRG